MSVFLNVVADAVVTDNVDADIIVPEGDDVADPAEGSVAAVQLLMLLSFFRLGALVEIQLSVFTNCSVNFKDLCR